MSFKTIETQEDLDKIIKERLDRVEKKYEGYISKEKFDEEIKKVKDGYIGFTSPEELKKVKDDYDSKLAKTKESTDELNRQISDLTKENGEIKLREMKYNVAHEFGIPRGMVDRLRGTTKEEIEQDAKSLSSFVKHTTPSQAMAEQQFGTSKDSKAGVKKLLNQFTE